MTNPAKHVHLKISGSLKRLVIITSSLEQDHTISIPFSLWVSDYIVIQNTNTAHNDICPIHRECLPQHSLIVNLEFSEVMGPVTSLITSGQKKALPSCVQGRAVSLDWTD